MTNPYQSPEPDDFPDKGNETSRDELASRTSRLGAAIFDGFVVTLPIVGLSYVMGVYDNIGPDGDLPIGDHIMGVIIGISVFMVVNGWGIYNRGQTVGKMAAGIKVVTLDGNRVSGNRYLLRRLLPIWVIMQAPFVGPLFNLVNVLLIFRPQRNCLHDDLAGTRVVKI